MITLCSAMTEGCGRHFVSKAKLIIHQDTRHGKIKPFSLLYCCTTLRNVSFFPGGYVCPVISCSAIFSSASLLQDHIAAHDSNVSLIKKRVRTKVRIVSNGAEDGAEEGRTPDFDMDDLLSRGQGNIDKCDGDEAMTVFSTKGDDDSNGDEDNDEDKRCYNGEDSDDEVFIISRAQPRRKRRRALTELEGEKEKRYKCPHPHCGRSFTEVGMLNLQLLFICQ